MVQWPISEDLEEETMTSGGFILEPAPIPAPWVSLWATVAPHTYIYM